MEYNLIYFIKVLAFSTVVLSEGPTCDKCVRSEHCEIFRNMSPTQQYVWMKKYPCSNILYNSYYVPYTNGIYVCCSDILWAIETGYGYRIKDNILTPEYPQIFNGGDIVTMPDDYQNYYLTGRSLVPSGPNLNLGPRGPNGPINPGGLGGTIRHQPKLELNTLPPRLAASQGQCLASNFPPNPETGCCGLEASDADRVIITSTARPVYPASYVLRPGKSPTNMGTPIRKKANETVNVTIDTRIAGGQETDLYQYPWTAQLIATFDYGQRQKSFDCGGSVISSRYVLTAGHCVYDPEGKLIKVEVYLAEYDRTTFPRDCKNVLSYGQQCIDNVVITAEEVTRHSEYDDDKLSNDIALVRLRENAPYTAFIRPICLTPIDMDNRNFANLSLAVAGWGRNGRYRSNIKQSTVVNLVPQEQCKKYYPSLLRSQMCAVGYSGEDTCKGDSGGPLMTVIGGKYYVVGIVSGKRADAACGTAVPSLYTNVYQYVDWILRNIRN